MKIVYSKHALEKFKDPSVAKFNIKKADIEEALNKPKEILDDQEQGVKLILGKLDKKHNLRIVYKEFGGIIIVITFHPAGKGRYEKKLL